MAVLSCTLTSEQTLAAEFNLDRQRAYELEYQIKTDGLMGPISLVLGAMVAAPNALPDIWDTYSCAGDSDLDAYCNKIRTSRFPKNNKLYKAVCSFATLPRGRDPGESQVNPLLRPVRYRGAKLIKTRAVTSDKDGKPITTSAREEFDESLEEDVAYIVLVAVRNVASLDAWVADVAQYYNSVNTTQYRAMTARKWWCVDIEISDAIYESGYSYYQETWQLALNLDTWDEGLLDRGWKILEGTAPNQRQVNATDADGKDLTAPVLLDGSGKKLALNAEPVERKFRVRREVNWTNIPV